MDSFFLLTLAQNNAVLNYILGKSLLNCVIHKAVIRYNKISQLSKITMKYTNLACIVHF